MSRDGRGIVGSVGITLFVVAEVEFEVSIGDCDAACTDSIVLQSATVEVWYSTLVTADDL